MKDFTPAQAARWVAQEVAKTVSRGPAAIQERIESEKFLATLGDMGYPRAFEAHNTLIEELKKLTH